MCVLQEGCSCCYVPCVASVVARCVRAVVARLAVDLLAVVFLVWRMVAGKSKHGALGHLRRIWNCALEVLVEVFLGSACVASAVLLVVVFSLKACVVWSFGLCVLVKVLPRIALCRFWWRFFPEVLCVRFGPPLCCPCGSKCDVWLGCVLVRFSQDVYWCFWWRFSQKLPDELSLLPVGLSTLQSAWALLDKLSQ
ncbi:hypothetical protein Taro_044114, partial [Colocasia esculenta]|nr:hypothetical protein [Colocasia esculenta]